MKDRLENGKERFGWGDGVNFLRDNINAERPGPEQNDHRSEGHLHGFHICNWGLLILKILDEAWLH